MTKPRPPTNPGASAEEPYIQGDPIPVPDAVEKNSDTTWEMFNEVAAKESMRYADTAPMTVPGEVRRPPPPPPRAAGVPLLEKLLAELTKTNRVCPIPAKWQALHDELVRDKPQGEINLLASPLTGSAWKATSSLAKRMTVKDQINWAASHGLADTAYRFLSHLTESEWFHIGDPEP